MIMHIPHSSSILPDTFKVSEGVSLKKEFQRMTDWFTDELFEYDEAKKLVFPYSRLYCDVERFRSGDDEPMAKKGMGVCYTTTSFGTKLREISAKESEFIKSNYYDPHPQKFENFVEQELHTKGQSLIVDCHSFSNEVLPHEESSIRPDICIGTDDFHTPEELISVVSEIFEKAGLSIAINQPFAGTMVPLKFLEKDKRISSIMIEVNRKLYLDDSFRKSKKFNGIKKLIANVVKKINELQI